MKRSGWAFAMLFGLGVTGHAADSKDVALPAPAPGTIRVATYNVSLHRRAENELADSLKAGDKQAAALAEIVALVDPDILLANEVDYGGGAAAGIWLEKYLAPATRLRHHFTAPVNTGEPSSMDLDGDGKSNGPGDAWGYGAYPGQYGMAVYSRFPIRADGVRSFREFLWSSMPKALRPTLPDGTSFYSDDVWSKLRLSSKSHWDVPIEIDGQTLHVLASHPTPPVFDGPEDRNGCRNHDEIRWWRDYVEGGADQQYMVDDAGQRGALDAKALFVLMGDLNADPQDGGGQQQAIQQLIASPRVVQSPAPESRGGVEAAEKQGRQNAVHRGPSAQDTGDFNDSSAGNLRCDFVLPSASLQVVAQGVFWPTADASRGRDAKWLDVSDHRAVWVDIKLP